MKKLYSLLALLTIGTLSFAQENWCGTDAHLNKQEVESPGLMDAINEQIMRRVQDGSLEGSDRAAPYVIPLVFHVLHEGGDENISFEQIESAVVQLNEDFNRTNADASDTRNTVNAPFAPIAADFEISFELAKLDPNGDCTNGVERKFAPGATNNADDDAKKDATGGLSAWNRNDYFNIWVVKSIASSGGGVTLGYAEFPYFATSNFGVIIRSDVVGTIGTASGDRTLTHEVGHCLGLLHTFQGGCHGGSACDEDGDFICDTPPVDEAHWSCVGTQNNCGMPPGDYYGTDVYDQWENYMSYAPCQNMFSEGQKALVHSNMEDITMFVNLTSSDNLDDAGVGLPDVLCKADFSSNLETVCAGGDIDFFDLSYSNVTGWNWTFEGGTPASSTDQNPTVNYSTGGVYDVTLEVTDGSSTVEVTFEDYITVLGNGEPLPYKEGFESYTAIPDGENFQVINQDGDRTWELLEEPIPAYGGNNCVWIDNHAEFNGDDDELISGLIDLSTVDASDDLIFSFYYSYKKRQSSNNESLKLYVSKDCGETWALRKNISGNNLSEEAVLWPWEPETQDDWEYVEVTNINDDYWVENFRYKLVWRNDEGNNIYIDNINIYPASMTGIVDPSKANHLKLFPNPTANNFTVELFSEEGQEYQIELYNALGQKVETLHNGVLGSGFQQVNYNSEALPQGVYTVKVSTEGQTQTLKLIKE